VAVATHWIDLVDPTRDEILGAIATPLDPDAVEMLAAPAGDGRSARPLLEGHGTYVVAVLAYPRAFTSEDRVEYLELDVLATPARVVTIRKSGTRGDFPPVDGIAARIDAGAEAGEAFHAAVDDAADAFLELLDGLYEEIDDLESRVEQLSGVDTRRRLAELRHELLLARRFASATRGVARRIVDGRIDVGKADLFPGGVEALFVDTYETLVRVTEEFDVARDLLAGVRDYYQAKITEQQNDVSKKLTMIASLVLVPSLIVGFYGQNFADEFREAYWSVGVSLGLIVATTLVQLAIFRWRRWF
jgi:Mg2+ and Co2+ transporter CorA